MKLVNDMSEIMWLETDAPAVIFGDECQGGRLFKKEKLMLFG